MSTAQPWEFHYSALARRPSLTIDATFMVTCRSSWENRELHAVDEGQNLHRYYRRKAGSAMSPQNHAKGRVLTLQNMGLTDKIHGFGGSRYMVYV